MKLRNLVFVIMLFPIIVSAYDFELDGIYYNILSATDLTVSVTNSGINKDPWGQYSGKDYSGNLTIPDKVDFSGRTLTVVDISTCAFNESNIEYITLPNTLKSISASAFEASKSLKEIIIPASIEHLGSFAFGDCSSLKKVIIEDSNSPLGIDVTNSYAGIFRLCPIEELYIGRDIDRSISLGESSWYDNNLSPFGFQELKSDNLIITIGPKVKSLCDCIFKNAKGLANVNIPETVDFIGKSAFEGCSQLKEVNILSKLSEIPNNAFQGCESLETIILPNSVKFIHSDAFRECFSLKSINLGGNMSLIGNSAFKSCSSLENIILPQSLEKIEESAFDQCSSLTTITALPYTPPQAVENSFSTTAYWNATLVIPYGTKSLYETMDCWKNFSNINEDMSNVAKYHLYYWVDGEEYKSYEIEYGAKLTPEPNPTKEYYTFSGWSEIPATMPANDIIVTGTFIINKYKISYQVDGEAYKTLEVEYGTSITPVPAPMKEGYTFSGWSEIPETMPANDITVTGTFTINKYKMSYQVDGEAYKTYEVEYGSSITPEPAPTKDGYVFSGWSTIPATMPAEDVTITGTFTLMTDVDEITIKDIGKTTWCSKYDLDFTNVAGIKAYTATGYNDVTKTIWLTRVMEVPAGTGILVKGDAGTYKIPHVSVRAYYTNMLVGNLGDAIKIEETDGDKTNYYLSGKDGSFVSVNGSANIGKNKAYLQLPTSVFGGTRSIGISYDDEDGTTSIKNLTPALTEGEGEWYTLQGQRVAKPGKGLYIRNGKKVIVR